MHGPGGFAQQESSLQSWAKSLVLQSLASYPGGHTSLKIIWMTMVMAGRTFPSG